jgi:phosphate transport system protein
VSKSDNAEQSDVRLRVEIEGLKKNILALSAVVEDAVRKALLATERRDSVLAQAVISGDKQIDALEVELEEECLKILALHQPVAMDLRFIIAVLKINNDLERTGDLAVNIAERAVYLADHKDVGPPPTLAALADRTQEMLHKSLDALVETSTELAREVIETDDEVDALHRGMYGRVQQLATENPAQVAGLFQWLSVSRYLERIADQATNIAEDVIYMMNGEIIRHRGEGND